MYEKFAKNLLTIMSMSSQSQVQIFFCRNQIFPHMALQDETFEEAIRGKKMVEM
jgi:hypothetical protein